MINKYKIIKDQGNHILESLGGGGVLFFYPKQRLTGWKVFLLYEGRGRKL